MDVFHRHHWLSVPWVLVALTAVATGQSSGNRLLGIDVSAWQGNISQTTWNNLRSVEDRRFVFIRATRGGTTGVDQRAGGFPSSSNTNFTLSQRYDDPYFVQNMNRATAAGMFAGSYHFSRPDIVASTTNSGGIANTAIDEANHYIEMAGAFMRPGYLVPTFDLEAGDGIRTDNEIAQFSIDFSNRIYDVMRIRPMMYINGNYAHNVLGGATAARRDLLAKPAAIRPSLTGPAFPQLWIARYVNQADPDSIDVQAGNPNAGLSTVYGPWDDYGTSQPWTFWQYASTGRLGSFNSGNSNLDFNVLNGGAEFLADQLVPAVWWSDTSGDWSTLANWNSGQSVTPPILAPGQLAAIGTQTLPVPRLPGAAGSGPTSGRYDTVILDRPNAAVTVTLSSGVHDIRKLYVRESFVMTGGTLGVNYVPVAESTPMSMQVSAPVSLSGGGRLSAHTIHVDPARTVTAENAVLTFDTLRLDRGATPGTLAVRGDLTVAGTAGGTATIGTNAGTAASGRIDLAGGNRRFTVMDGAAPIDLLVTVPITNGGLLKSGLGTMHVTGVNTYSGPTTVAAGTLQVGNASGVGSSHVTVEAGGTLAVGVGTTLRAPAVTVAGGTVSASTLAVNGTSGIGTLAINGGTIAGSPIVAITAGGEMRLGQDARVAVTIGGLWVDQAVSGGRLDLGAGQVAIAAGGITAADLRADLIAGRNAGAWNGTAGIMSGTAAASGGTRTVGYVVNGDGSARVSFAAAGDVDLNGAVDVFDLVSVNSGGRYGSGTASVWSQGDFNYDGVTNVFDLVGVNAAGVYGRGGYFPAAPAAFSGSPAGVPEPGTWAVLVGVGAMAASARRRMVRR
jgi:autotransporter-associated beta strand protein